MLGQFASADIEYIFPVSYFQLRLREGSLRNYRIYGVF